jgi:cobalamin biosynthesis Co2+ chelatase CbiK
MDEYEVMVAEEQIYKAKLFTYPEWQSPSAIFDYEDLENDDTFMVLCVRAKKDEVHRQKDTVYVWHGAEHEVSQEHQKTFLEKCIE